VRQFRKGPTKPNNWRKREVGEPNCRMLQANVFATLFNVQSVYEGIIFFYSIR